MSKKTTKAQLKTFHHISAKFGIMPMEKRTVKGCLAKAALIQRLIDNGSIPEKYVPLARQRVSNFKTSAKETAAKLALEAKKAARRQKAAAKKSVKAPAQEQAAQVEAPVAAPAANDGQVA